MDFVYASKVILHKASQLSRMRVFAGVGRDDIAQSLWLHLIENGHKYDRSRGSIRTYISCLVNRRAVSMIRFQTAARRDPAREAYSLQEVVADGDEREVFRSETTQELFREGPSCDLAIDLSEAERVMVAQARLILKRIRLGIPTTREQRDSLKQYLVDRGLEDYLR